MKRKNIVYNPRFLAAIVGVALLVLLLVLASNTPLLSEEESAALEELSATHSKYMQEKGKLEKELDTLQTVDVSKTAMLAAGFMITEPKDIELIRTKSTEYSFSPVLVFTCEQDLESVTQCLKNADKSWEIVIDVQEYAEDTVQKLNVWKSHMTQLQFERELTVKFVKEITEEQQKEILTACNLSSCISYNDSPEAGQNNDDSVYFDYAKLRAKHFSARGLQAFTDRLTSCYTRRAAMLCIFDLDQLNRGEVTPEQLDKALKILKEQTQKENCVFADVKSIVAELSLFNARKAEIEAAHGPRIAEIKARLAELDALLDALHI